jgi:hypothetical protein
VRTQELLTRFREANAFIHGARVTAQEGVLVHWFVATVVLGPKCHSLPLFLLVLSLSHMGVSRSATIVAAYCALLTRPLFFTSDISIARRVSVMTSRPPFHDDTAALAFLRSRRRIVQPNSGFLDQLALYGRCDCDLEANPTAVESWRAGRNSGWEGRVDKRRQEQKKAQSSWTKGWGKVGKWGTCLLM